MHNLLQTLAKYQFILILIVGWGGSVVVSDYFEGQRMAVMRTAVLGNAVVQTKNSLLADSDELPILRVKSSKHSATQSEIDESLFTMAKTEQKKLVQEPQKNVMTVDYFAEAKASILHQINIDAVLSNGAILNGRFYKRGELIDVSFIAPDGELFKTKLVSVSDKSIHVGVNGKRVVISYDF